jgi:type I restriction enzyme R subunit
MFNFVQELWQEKIQALEKQLGTLTQQEAQELERKLKWMRETEMAVVVSQEQNEVQTFKNWGVDILPHREKMEKRELDKEFKDSNNPFRVVFVCAMWLTGFDVKSLATVYLDKPLKAHTLMQTIARANRVYEGKSNGLIVDYIGVVKALRQALSDYTSAQGGGSNDGEGPAIEKEKLIDRMIETLEAIQNHLRAQGFELEALICAKDFEKLALLKQGANAVCASKEVKKRFEILARELFKLFKYVTINEVGEDVVERKNAISAIYDMLQEKVQHADNSALMAKLNEIVSRYIEVVAYPLDQTPPNEYDATGDRRFDISKINFERLKSEFEYVKNKNLLFKELQEVVEQRLNNLMRHNPLRINYYERYQEIIEAYNLENQKDNIAILFEQLMHLVDELDEEQKRYVREGFESDEELSIYDLLVSGQELTKADIKSVKALAKELLSTIKARIQTLDNWREKEETRAIISTKIRDLLWAQLPECYTDQMLMKYRDNIYEYIYNAYPAA